MSEKKNNKPQQVVVSNEGYSKLNEHLAKLRGKGEPVHKMIWVSNAILEKIKREG